MCGLAGYYTNHVHIDPVVIDRMADSLAHRGPDSRGTWVDREAGLALGHRRLAIRDLSPTGHQPMVSSCGRYVIAYNGEVYSHKELAQDLEQCGRRLKGTSDTEVILEACAQWGLSRVLPRLIGMFAIALWDRATGELKLARDRLGIKPLYWGEAPGLFFFGSELKALRAFPGWTPRLDRNAVAAFLRHGYIPGPHSIYHNVHKLEPGTTLTLRADLKPQIEPYWELNQVVANSAGKLAGAKPEEVIDQLDTLLLDAVRRRLVADVPVGALLSGGIDSSLVTALMVEASGQRVRTFTASFAEGDFDEAPYARAVAQHLGTEHTEVRVAPEDALGLVDRLPHWCDEPFADSSMIATQLVCALTRQSVPVVLTGDGGDELFAGYPRYVQGYLAAQQYGALRGMAMQLAARASRTAARGLNLLPSAANRAGSLSRLATRLGNLSVALAHSDPDSRYLYYLSHWAEPEALVPGSKEPKGVLWDRQTQQLVPHLVDRMQYVDTLTYLPDDVLTKVDRASMSVALEARVPLLDHRIVEMSWGLPRAMKFRDGGGKWILKELLCRRVPRELVERPKMGFGVPFDRWIRGPLRPWASHLLDERRLKEQGLLEAAPIQERWRAHLEGENWGYPLWNVLMLQAWLDANPGVTG